MKKRCSILMVLFFIFMNLNVLYGCNISDEQEYKDQSASSFDGTDTSNSEKITENNTVTIQPESISEKAYITLRDYYITANAYDENNGKIDVEGNAFIKSRLINPEQYENTYAVVQFMTMTRTVYLNSQNNIFKQFYFDSNVVYCDGEYGEKDGLLNFNYKDAYLYKDNFNDVYQYPDNLYLNKVEIKNTDYEYYEPHLAKVLHEVTNANKYGFVADVPTDRSWHLNGLPTPYFNTNIDDEYKWTESGYSSESCQLYIKDKYILTDQKGWNFDSITNNNEFTLNYSNSEIIGESDKAHNLKIQFNKDKTWHILSSDEDYEGVNSGNWELIDDCILSIIEYNAEYDEQYICFLYLDFEKKQLSLPLFVECNDMLKYIHMVDDLNQQHFE